MEKTMRSMQIAFNPISSRRDCPWNDLICGHIRCGNWKQALSLYKQAPADSKHPNGYTFVALVRVCTRRKDLKTGRTLHADIANEGLLRSNVFVGGALIDMYAKCGSLAEAQEVFDVLPVQNVVTWTALIGGYSQNDQGDQALQYFQQMRRSGIAPNAVTYACALKACGGQKDLQLGKELHAEVENKGILQRNQYVGNALVDMYAKCGMLARAQSVFDKLASRDRVSWNALISGHLEQEQGKKVLNHFRKMQQEGISPDFITYTCVLKACARIGAVEEGIKIHDNIKKDGLSLKDDILFSNALVDMYAKCGELVRAQEVFDQLADPCILTWTALIDGYAQQGQIKNALHYFDRMKKCSVKPDSISFLSILSACNHAGLVDKGQEYFEMMWVEYGIPPSLMQYACMVDLCGRAGQLHKVVAMAKKAPFQPTVVMWLNILTACRKWGDVELGRRAFEHALRLDRNDSASYMLMVNIYIDSGMYKDAEEIGAKIMNLNVEI